MSISYYKTQKVIKAKASPWLFWLSAGPFEGSADSTNNTKPERRASFFAHLKGSLSFKSI
jgi:hypothetical protein